MFHFIEYLLRTTQYLKLLLTCIILYVYTYKHTHISKCIIFSGWHYHEIEILRRFMKKKIKLKSKVNIHVVIIFYFKRISEILTKFKLIVLKKLIVMGLNLILSNLSFYNARFFFKFLTAKKPYYTDIFILQFWYNISKCIRTINKAYFTVFGQVKNTFWKFW